MPSEPLSLDTAPDIERLLTQTAFDLAFAGIRQRHPHASPREQFLRLAVITLGADLAGQAFPDLATLNTP